MKKPILALLMAGSLLTVACEKPAVETELEANTEQSIAKSNKAEVISTYSLDQEQSVAEWVGSGPAASHHGSFSVASPYIKVVNKKIKEGSFVIPIASIKNFDLPDQVKPVLLDHLKSPDFFNMALYPEATFNISRFTPLPKPEAGAVAGAQYKVTGDFMMLGVVNEISFPAKIEFSGDDLSMEAVFEIDRTKWGMNYGADPALGDHHIYPEVKMHLKLKGKKE